MALIKAYEDSDNTTVIIFNLFEFA